MVNDLHRDGVPENVHLVTEIDEIVIKKFFHTLFLNYYAKNS